MRSILFILALLSLVLSAQASETESKSTVSIVLLAEPKLPSARQFQQELASRLAGRLKITGVEHEDADAIALRVGEAIVLVRLVPKPAPEALIKDLCVNAWYWRQACEATSGHRAQAVVGVMQSSLDALDTRLLLTDAVSAVMNDNAIASYWLASLQSRDAFLRKSAKISREEPPIWLWVNFRITNDAEKGFSLSTSGMDQLGLNEIEAKDVNRSGREVFPLLLGMAQYLASKGPVIKDGETIGDSPQLNIRVHQGKSYWRDGLNVYRVTWPK
ncbi:DUF4261 domain-containing protein [Ideonella paludis]|uniref:DUF4261 domain-containing protein n=1 Tax=Ideonella paludis TaxID=1233411 RepID=A0ABS5E031_9BURK|nr:DUF4261 domain-containing protein [Ideonella paludis]